MSTDRIEHARLRQRLAIQSVDELDRRDIDDVTALLVEAGGRRHHLLDLGHTLGDLFVGGVLAEDRRQALLVDDHGDRHLGNGIAVGNGGDLL